MCLEFARLVMYPPECDNPLDKNVENQQSISICDDLNWVILKIKMNLQAVHHLAFLELILMAKSDTWDCMFATKHCTDGGHLSHLFHGQWQCKLNGTQFPDFASQDWIAWWSLPRMWWLRLQKYTQSSAGGMEYEMPYSGYYWIILSRGDKLRYPAEESYIMLSMCNSAKCMEWDYMQVTSWICSASSPPKRWWT